MQTVKYTQIDLLNRVIGVRWWHYGNNWGELCLHWFTIVQFFCGVGRLLLELVEFGFSLDWYDFVMQVFDEDLAVVSPCILDGA